MCFENTTLERRVCRAVVALVRKYSDDFYYCLLGGVLSCSLPSALRATGVNPSRSFHMVVTSRRKDGAYMYMVFDFHIWWLKGPS